MSRKTRINSVFTTQAVEEIAIKTYYWKIELLLLCEPMVQAGENPAHKILLFIWKS